MDFDIDIAIHIHVTVGQNGQIKLSIDKVGHSMSPGPTDPKSVHTPSPIWLICGAEPLSVLTSSNKQLPITTLQSSS